MPTGDTADPGDLLVDSTEVCGGFVCSGDLTKTTFEANGAGYDGNGNLALTNGAVSMQIDFTDSKLKNFSTDRNFVDTTLAGGITNTDLPDLVLNDTTITDGSFEGTVNSYEADGSVVENGTYQGFFGGADASVAGGLVRAVGEFDFDGTEGTDPDDVFTARDLGVFTADRLDP